MPETVKTPEIVEADAPNLPVDRKLRREMRQERLANASNVTFALDPAVRRFVERQAKEAGMDLTHFMQKMVESHVISTAPEGDTLATRLAAKRYVLDRAVNLAVKMDADGRFEPHFILHVVQEAGKDARFMQQYARATGDEKGDNPKRAERARISLNQQIGRLIKKAAGAKSQRKPNGTIARAQVKDQMISTYTLLTKKAA